ncbi:MAG: aspartyl/asparaginyl beta-hydroxylase domain-containing protein [Planctomycetes bacterium]|nr:aspartyl/asparaginyl beta-hydroxylase domain-containing protein [Planctomycetota bacterium]
MSGFVEAARFAFVPRLEAATADIRRELRALPAAAFAPAADSLTTVEAGYDETGWLYFDLHGDGDFAVNRARCPITAAAVAEVPGLRNAGFSRFVAGTHLYPHRGELPGVLRCHLPLEVPAGDLGIRFGDETRRWQFGRCLIIDDTQEHTAWNHGDGDRVVLLITFTDDRASVA